MANTFSKSKFQCLSEAIVRKYFLKKGVLKTFASFTRKHQCLLNKVAGL